VVGRGQGPLGAGALIPGQGPAKLQGNRGRINPRINGVRVKLNIEYCDVHA